MTEVSSIYSKDTTDALHRLLEEFNFKDFTIKPAEKRHDAYMISVPNRTVTPIEVKSEMIGEDNFEDAVGLMVDISNWIYRSKNSQDRFYGKPMKVVNAKPDLLIVQAAKDIYIEIDPDMVFEWFDPV